MKRYLSIDPAIKNLAYLLCDVNESIENQHANNIEIIEYKKVSISKYMIDIKKLFENIQCDYVIIENQLGRNRKAKYIQNVIECFFCYGFEKSIPVIRVQPKIKYINKIFEDDEIDMINVNRYKCDSKENKKITARQFIQYCHVRSVDISYFLKGKKNKIDDVSDCLLQLYNYVK